MERALVHVDVGECRCEPDHPHKSDWVKLVPEATVEIGTAIYAAIRVAGDDNIRMQGLMARAYLQGIREWSFTHMGEPVRIEPSSEGWSDTLDRFLPWARGGMQVADTADGLYSEPILRPFLRRTSKQSPDGLTDGSTFPIRSTSSKPRAQSRRSSRRSSVGKPSAVPDH